MENSYVSSLEWNIYWAYTSYMPTIMRLITKGTKLYLRNFCLWLIQNLYNWQPHKLPTLSPLTLYATVISLVELLFHTEDATH